VVVSLGAEPRSDDGDVICKPEKMRRSVLESVLGMSAAVMVSLRPDRVMAATDGDDAQKPSVPLEALIPATRVRVLIDRAVDAVSNK